MRRLRRPFLCFLSALFVLVAGCGSSARVSSPGSTTTTRGDVTSTSRPSPTPGLRGVPVSSFTCPQPAEASAGSPVPLEAVQEFLLCPSGTPGSPSEGITVGTTEPVFEELVRALSAPDAPPSPGQICPAYADLLQVVLARANGHAYQVSVPTDACHHYQRDALETLRRARAG